MSTRGMLQRLADFSQYMRNDVKERLLPKPAGILVKPSAEPYIYVYSLMKNYDMEMVAIYIQDR